ncbi:helix-turn-helix domain-containing protein [Niabella insulamsoli]|uniref:helix-turn-helix domain-containing protein n=1 Tax=Niabella insulamsoli TaxID=3144874 RepID=UPI003CCC7090
MKTINEVAEILRVSTSTVRKEIKRGALGTVIIRGTYRITDKQLADYLKKHTVNAR